MSLLSSCFKAWYYFLTCCVFVIVLFKVWFISLPVVSLLSCCFKVWYSFLTWCGLCYRVVLKLGIISLPVVSLLSCCLRFGLFPYLVCLCYRVVLRLVFSPYLLCLCYRVVLRLCILSLSVVSLLSCCFKVGILCLTCCVFVIVLF